MSPAPVVLRAFPLRQLAVLRAVVAALVGVPLDGARVDAVVREVDAQVAAASFFLLAGLVLVFDVLRIMPLVVLRRAALLDRLSIDEAAHCLDRIDRSPRLAILLVAPKTLCTIAFYELPGELERVGYIPARRRYLASPVGTERT